MTLKEIVTLPAEAKFPIDMNDKDDVGTTTFVASYKPITLMRYIRKAMENETLITIDKSKLK